MPKITKQQFNDMVRDYGDAIPGLKEKLEENLRKDFEIVEPADPNLERITHKVVSESLNISSDSKAVVSPERIIIATAGARPVAKILHDKVTDQFLGKNTENSPWGPILMQASGAINKSIPAIGRIELKNGDMPWCGTGWIIDEGIIVTNAHVADIFAQLDDENRKFVFKPGILQGDMSSGIDFLKEENNNSTNEHPVIDVLYIAPSGETDVAFLRVKQAEGGLPLPGPIELGSEIEDGAAIAAIGYPARDPSIRDQELVISIFGSEVYDKKRLSPGKVKIVDEERLHHDCSTLGGNSGSVLIDLKTGKAIGLHQGGFLDDSANLGVTVTHLKKLLDKVKSNLNDLIDTENTNKPEPIMDNKNDPGEVKFTVNIPLEITIKAGQVTVNGVQQPSSANYGNIDEAVRSAKEMLSSNPSVTSVRAGYRFKNGWITDEKVIVVEVKEKLEFKDLIGTGKKPLPREINGIGVDVRTAPMPDQIDKMGIDINLLALERKAKPAGYAEPPGFDKEGSKFFLGRVIEDMDAIFHVSPDAGFKHLKDFFERTNKNITATIYEWEVNHISDVLADVMKGSGKSLKMVTQRTGVGESDATISAVEDMQARIGNTKFKHVYASTRGEDRLIPNSYHIKVASRDDEEFWLSSGNWKDSNQPLNPTAFSTLARFNREWHAIVKNEKLATLFRNYIEFDFEQAKKFPTEIKEALKIPDLEFFVPDPNLNLERITGVNYTDTLTIKNERLDIQPLLTPDKDPNGGQLFMNHVIAMVKRARKSLYIQNQSFNFTEDNNAEFDELFEEIRKKQRAIGDVRIIFRDAHDFGRAKDLENQQVLLERLKRNGLNTSTRKMRLQRKCHNKGIIIDSKEVLLGSQNFTNGGSLFNRDASLLVRNEKVAAFYEKIFLFDWENRTHNTADESVAPLRIAQPGEATPEGFRRVTLKDLIGERM